MKTITLATLVLFLSMNAMAADEPARAPAPAPSAQQVAQVAPSPVLATMDKELDREMPILSKASPPAYFISYTLTSTDRTQVMGSNGALLSSDDNLSHWLETQVRVGSYELDNTHKVGNAPASGSSDATAVPVDNAPEVLRRAMWKETDEQYRAASEALIKISTSKEVQSQNTEDQAPDFSREPPHVFYGPEVSIHVDRKPWEAKVRLYTAAFRASPQILNSIVTFSAQAVNQYQVNSEGTRLQFGLIHYRLELYIQGKAPDGMNIDRYYNYDWNNPANAPDDKTVLAEGQVLRKQLEGLVAAPLVEPFAGPALLTGRAAAVFFHEVFGHRDEGFRQKDITEGQTFAQKVGQLILPKFISIYDDPTKKTLGNDMLLGYYPFDDEGIPAQRVTLVDHGVLRNFEMSRQPLNGFPHSNGHGRRQIGAQPISRQGNLIIRSSVSVSNAELRRKLIAEIKRQGKPFGLLIDDIAGGFTFTGRGQPQAFQVQPLVVYKVFADGRPDQLVRGVDIVGTPLVSLTKILATGNTEEVFNGYCGAESGSVPV
ncbi:MAG TPA: metallopeptidase TldD-related protein, partial [Candidatus Dormibacteraeota bacterium]|nr:metallopeptidase TldD-related protein [Candidatus Dormibacteraeota bacterium]